jgi:hypothetical protein
MAGAFQIVVSVLRLWSVGTPTTAACPGWCPHQPATIWNAKMASFKIHVTIIEWLNCLTVSSHNYIIKKY